MTPSSANPLMSSQKNSQLQAILHPLVLLAISDYITRHTLRQQKGPIVGALLGQQNGREISIEHAFDCHTRLEPGVEGGFLLDANKFSSRLEQSKFTCHISCQRPIADSWKVMTVHKERPLDLVGWYTLLPTSGPTSSMLPIYHQILAGWNESAVLIGLHPEEILQRSVGGKLPLTIYESSYEVDDVKNDNEDEDRNMDDGESAPKLRFREVPYTVETDETEMISMNYVAGAGGSASAASVKEERLARTVESNGKGKRRIIENEVEDARNHAPPDMDDVLTREEEQTLASLTAKANAVKMLHARVRLLIAYLEHLPSDMASGDRGEADSMDTDGNVPSLRILRQIHAIVGRLDHVIPSDMEAFDRELLQQSNDVQLVGLLNTVMQGVCRVRDVGKKACIIDASSRAASRRAPAEQFAAGSSSFTLPGSGDIFI